MSSLIVEVCEIKDIQPHPNADRLAIATVKGWNCIVGKEDYQVGDWVVFFPPDSVLPEWLIEKYRLEFLKKGNRVGTLKLRGCISQGLILPIMCLSSVQNAMPELGEDVKDILGVAKYEIPEKSVQIMGKVTSKRIQNPYFTKYTDIENIQNFPDVFQDGDMVVITEKIHGSNVRFGWLPIEINFKSWDWLGILRSLWKKYILHQTHEFVYGSHNVQLQWDNQKNIYAKVLKDYDIKNLPRDIIFYGEVYGKGIHGFVPVPTLYVGEFYWEVLNKETIGNSVIELGQIREGCVVKSLNEENHPHIDRKILKSINPEYLARKNRTEYH